MTRLSHLLKLALLPLAVAGAGAAALVDIAGQTPLASPARDMQTFRSALRPDNAIRYVSNSGVCETTPGVGQKSGYIDIGADKHMWFWFFESRTDPDNAPLTLWLNGGPGCSSLIGMFQENGPCTVKEDNKTTELNPYSWNNISNVIYIDQPMGSGFSWGSMEVNSTDAAARVFWDGLQVLFESPEFAPYATRELIFATESYGGHYGPQFIKHFRAQNARIDAGALDGVKIDVSALLIINGWYDPLLQYEARVFFAADAPGYGPLQNGSVLAQLGALYYAPGACRDRVSACAEAGFGAASDAVCRDAVAFCDQILTVARGDRDEYDLRQTAPAPFPPEGYVGYLAQPAIMRAIGVDPETAYNECSDAVAAAFDATGDIARSKLHALGDVVNAGLRTVIWAGDADISCNWLGGQASVLAMRWFGDRALLNTPLTNVTLRGTPVAAVQNVFNFTFARVYGAGHEVPAFVPEAAFEMFKQVVKGEPLHSVP